ncbi:hypothetical protein ACGC1H_006068 [Rhizoctonia solani]
MFTTSVFALLLALYAWVESAQSIEFVVVPKKFDKCSSYQRAELHEVLQQAEKYAKASENYLDQGSPTLPLYIKWFGAYNRNNYGEVHSHFKRLSKNVIDWRYSCTCTKKKIPVRPNTNYPRKIELCPPFWSLANTNSRAFNIIRSGALYTQKPGAIGLDDHMPNDDAINDRAINVHGSFNSLILAKADKVTKGDKAAEHRPVDPSSNPDSYAYFAVDAFKESQRP